ncbi:MAG TPA: HD domain-containing phosphohydrolase [Myxococcaceae bacterium]|nr:HD domain-containing phosphohydrolase [Myxococcaceae bacterium]
MNRILVVDDDALILQALSRILQAEGYEVICHLDPLKAVQERDFTVVISDFMMPQMNGVELLSQLRKNVPAAIRVLLTAAGDFKVASDAINRGEVYRILSKPWSIADLSSCVKQAVEHFRLVEENAALSREIGAKNQELMRINKNLESLVVERTNGLLEGLISALDYRDTETQWHSRRVSLYSRRIGEELGLSDEQLSIVEQGALLHDIGKIGVRDSILHKPGPLTPQEWVEMRLHPDIGYRMLTKMPYLHQAALVVLQHQERFDGHGYPSGIAGRDIVLGARIFAVSDAVDAINSDRPYRKGRPLAVAREEIKRCKGSQFDPMVVDAFLQIPDEEWTNIRLLVENQEAEEFKQLGAPASGQVRRARDYAAEEAQAKSTAVKH